MMDLAQCAPDIHPQTLQAIIQVESSGNPLAINVNGIVGKVKASTKPRAIKLAKYYIAQGYSVDLGLMQVNSANLKNLGVNIDEMFEPCANINAGAHILIQAYKKGASIYGAGQDALQVALSIYNTGNINKGFENGYVTKYYKASHRSQPQSIQTLSYSKYYALDNSGDKSIRIPSEIASNSSAKSRIKASRLKSSNKTTQSGGKIPTPLVNEPVSIEKRIDYYLLSQALTAPTSIEWNPPDNYYSTKE